MFGIINDFCILFSYKSQLVVINNLLLSNRLSSKIFNIFSHWCWCNAIEFRIIERVGEIKWHVPH